MNELSPAARELVDAHRTDRTLTPADRTRIKHKVMLRVAALGAAAAIAGRAAGMSLASKVALVALGVAAVTGAMSVSLWTLRARAPSEATPSATSGRTVTDIVAPAPGPAAPTVATPVNSPAGTPAVMAVPGSTPRRVPVAKPRIAAAAPASAVVRSPPATPAVMAAPVSSAPVDSRRRDELNTIDERPAVPAPQNPSPASLVVPPDPEPELRALREAREDLRAGRPARAYRLLEDFKRRQSGGMLGQERSALAAIALCQWQPGPQAQARAAEFLRSAPEAPLASRVRSNCAQAHKASP